MNDTTYEGVRTIYDQVRTELCEHHRREMVENPDKDFTRKTKITLDLLMQFVVSLGAEGLKPGMMDFMDCTGEWSDAAVPPYESTITESRKKVRPEAFRMLFNGVTTKIMERAVSENDPGVPYHLRLMAVDGCSFPYDGCSEYADEKYHARGTRVHVQECTAICDMGTNIFTDAAVHGVAGKATGEPSDFCMMVDRAVVPEGEKYLYIGDRIYATANAMAHVQESGQFYEFRAKDINSNGFISSLRLPDREFDMTLSVRIGWNVPHLSDLSNGKVNHCLGANTNFDYLDRGTNKTYTLQLRIVRQKIRGEWIVILTNLPSEHYTTEDVLKFYDERYGIEVCFRDLKYTMGTLCFHARIDKLITQELWAKLLMFNMTSAVAASAPQVVLDTARSVKTRKLAAVFEEKGPDQIAVDFVAAVHTVRIELLRRKRSSLGVAAMIVQYKERIRPGRHEERHMHQRRRFYLNYRAA